MKTALLLAVLTVTAVFARRVEVDDLNPVAIDGDWLQYDDGSGYWITWDGAYRGTWFNIQDFVPFATAGWLELSRLWFYHHESYPWDISDCYVEIWNGDATGGPSGTRLDQQTVTAVHYAPIFVDYNELTVEQNFWCIVNTELSAACWPSIVSDGNNPDPSAIPHSFLSDDFIVWEPYTVDDMHLNYFVAVLWHPGALDNTTWGSLKATF